MASISDAQQLAVREGWISDPVVPGLYVSAGGDTQPLPLLHPEFLTKQGAPDLAHQTSWSTSMPSGPATARTTSCALRTNGLESIPQITER